MPRAESIWTTRTPAAKPTMRPKQLPSSMSPLQAGMTGSDIQPPTAIIYCEGNFGRIDGKTANGLVRHSGICQRHPVYRHALLPDTCPRPRHR